MVADPVLQERAQKLEAMSRTYEDKLTQDILGNVVKRSNSLDRWELWTVLYYVVTVFCAGSPPTGRVLQSCPSPARLTLSCEESHRGPVPSVLRCVRPPRGPCQCLPIQKLTITALHT